MRTQNTTDVPLDNMWGAIELYEPLFINQFTRPPLYTPPGVGYSPGMNF